MEPTNCSFLTHSIMELNFFKGLIRTYIYLASLLKMSSIIQVSLMILTDVCFPYSDAAKTWLFLPHNGLQPYWCTTASGGCEKPLQPNAAILKPSHENDLLKAAFSSGTKTGFFALHTVVPRPEYYSCLSKHHIGLP